MLIIRHFNEILMKIYIFWLKKMHVKMSSQKWCPFCLSLNVLSHPYVFILATPFSYFFLPTISFWCMILRHWYGCLCLNKKLCHEHIQTFNIYQSHGNPNAYEHMKPWWRHQMETFFSRYWPFVWGIHRSSPHKDQWRGALMFSLICVGINGWIKNPEAGDLRCYCTHYDISVMFVEPNLANVWWFYCAKLFGRELV